MSFKEVMSLPLKTFWCFSKNIDRLRAEADLRLLDVMASATANEAFEKLQERLQKQLGTIVKMSADHAPIVAHAEELDRAGFANLKAMM